MTAPERLPDGDEEDSLKEITSLLEEEEITDSLPDRLWIHCYTQDDGYFDFLTRIEPDVVVMYEADLGFIRALELYSHCNPTRELSVSLLIYSESVEEQLQLLHIRQEKEAFENLIKIKANMAPPVENEVVEDADDLLTTKYLGIMEEAPRRLVIDMRELRSSLPFVLYKHNFILEPLTIDVGDYILTPEICVERKSTSDLIQSLNNGRLYSQAEQMCRHYAKPILLIEFDENKPFSLLPHGDLRSDISISDVSSKLCLLLLHFPQLKLVWSPSLSITAEIFRDIKRDHPEPVISEGSSEGADPIARDLLLSLPGVTQQNYYILMRHVRNIRELCERSRADLTDLLGVENATKLYTFLHEPINKT